MKLVVAKGLVQRLVREAERRRRVAAPAAEARRDRDPLLDVDVPAVRDTCRPSEGCQRPSDNRVVGEAFDQVVVGRCERDRVVQIDLLEHGDDLVLGVLAQRAD